MSTKRFLLQKILQLFLTLFLVTAITFILMKLSPIDAAEAYARRVFTVDNSRIELIREEMGLNRPLVVQYLDWLGDLLHLDLGTSLVDNKDVFLIVGTAAKETACVVLLATVLQAVGALILGTLLYLARKNFVGKVLGFISIAAISIPAFYLATSFIDVVAVRWNLMSVAGNTGLMRYLPAALCLAVSGIAFFGQMLSKTIQRAMNEDSVLYARCPRSQRPLYRGALCSSTSNPLHRPHLYANDGDVHGRVRYCREHLFPAGPWIPHCGQPDKPGSAGHLRHGAVPGLCPGDF